MGMYGFVWVRMGMYGSVWACMGNLVVATTDILIQHGFFYPTRIFWSSTDNLSHHALARIVQKCICCLLVQGVVDKMEQHSAVSRAIRSACSTPWLYSLVSNKRGSTSIYLVKILSIFLDFLKVCSFFPLINCKNVQFKAFLG